MSWNKSRVDPICDVVPCEMPANMCQDTRFISTFGHRSSNLEVTGLLPPDTMMGLLKYAGIYLCNTRETFGIGTLEAMACGVPVLGWAWGGQKEIIEHKKEGWLAIPGDFESLKEGLYYIREHRAEMSRAARKLAEQTPGTSSLSSMLICISRHMRGLKHRSALANHHQLNIKSIKESIGNVNHHLQKMN